MQEHAFTIIDNGRPVKVPARIIDGTARLSNQALATALGWELTPEGLCGNGVCVPVPPGSSLVSGDGIDLAELAAILDRPIALDPAERSAYLGASARDRGEALASLQAPDFGLPDLDGRLHVLSDHRGKKVLLIAYASW